MQPQRKIARPISPVQRLYRTAEQAANAEKAIAGLRAAAWKRKQAKAVIVEPYRSHRHAMAWARCARPLGDAGLRPDTIQPRGLAGCTPIARRGLSGFLVKAFWPAR